MLISLYLEVKTSYFNRRRITQIQTETRFSIFICLVRKTRVVEVSWPCPLDHLFAMNRHFSWMFSLKLQNTYTQKPYSTVKTCYEVPGPYLIKIDYHDITKILTTRKDNEKELLIPNRIKLFHWMQNDMYLRSNAFLLLGKSPMHLSIWRHHDNFDALQLEREGNHTFFDNKNCIL